MALDKVLKVYDDNGNEIDYDILASDVKFLPDGKDLPTKLAELEDKIGQGGYAPPAGGIPKTDLAQSVQDSLDKADSALQEEDLADYATKTELQQGLGNKQDTLVAGNGIVIAQDGKTVSVAEAIRTGAGKGATAYQKPASGIPASDIASGVIPTLPQNIVQSITINGTPHTPTNGVVDLGNVAGEKGDKGDKGDTVVIDPSQVEQFDIINSLNAQAAGNALDAYQGARLKSQIDYVYARLQAVYAALGNIAFWDGKPASATILPNLDWGLPKHTLTLNLTLSNATVKVNGTAYSNGETLSVEEYSTLSVLIEPSADHLFNTAPTLTFGGQSVTLTPNQDGSYSADVVMGQSDATIAVVATGVASYSISYGTMTNCSVVTSPAPTSILGGQSVEIEFSVDSGYQLDASCFTVDNASKAWDASTNKLTISNATGNVTISATAAISMLTFLKGYRLTDYDTISDASPWTCSTGDRAAKAIVSEMVRIPAVPEATSMPTCSVYWFHNCTGSIPIYIALYSIDNGVFTPIVRYNKSGATNKVGISFVDYASGKSSQDVIDAYKAGNLGVRVTLSLDNVGTGIAMGTELGFQVGAYKFSPQNPAGTNFKFTEDATGFLSRIFEP